MTEKPRKPWKRQKNEGSKPFAAFIIYRDLGPNRVLRQVAGKLGLTLAFVQRWSSKWKWVSRVHAWEDEQDRLNLIYQQREIADMARRHAHNAEMAIEVHGLVLNEMMRRIRNNMLSQSGDKLTGMSNSDLTKLSTDLMNRLESMTRVERVARGVPATWVQITEMDDVQLEAYVQKLLSDDVEQ